MNPEARSPSIEHDTENFHGFVVDDSELPSLIAEEVWQCVTSIPPTLATDVESANQALSQRIVRMSDGNVVVVFLDSNMPLEAGSNPVQQAQLQVLAHLDKILSDPKVPRIYVAILRYTGSEPKDAPYNHHKVFLRENVLYYDIGKPLNLSETIALIKQLSDNFRARLLQFGAP